jgi:hypothetical protein
MSQVTTELRNAAASARAFADSVGSPDLKHSFKEMARRWEMEADEREIEELRISAAKRGRAKLPPSRKH